MTETSSSTTEDVVGKLPVKKEAGQISQAKDIAKVFLHNRFPEWKDDNKTYMIPPIFQAKQSRHRIGITQPVVYTEGGDNGESIIYKLLEKLGDVKRMGMFVVHGFELKDIRKWNKKYQSKGYAALELTSNEGEFDFIIFHHQLGIILLEVKNNSKNEQVKKANKQLELSYNLIKKFAGQNNFSIPYRKVISLPSTKKADFNSKNDYKRGDDTLLLFEDDSKDFSSFWKWWNEAIESPAMIQMSAETQEAYKRALSYTLMIRHMGPVTETEWIGKIYESLITYKYHGSPTTTYPQVMEKKFPVFLTWCGNVLEEKDKRKKEENDSALKTEEKKLQQSFIKKNKLSEKDLNKALEFLEDLLKNSKYIDGNEWSLMDDAISALFEESYCLSDKNILKYINKMRDVSLEIKEKDNNEEEVLEKYPFLKLQSPKDLNMLERHLARSTFIDGDEPSKVDKYLYESLTRIMKLKRDRQPGRSILSTSEQKRQSILLTSEQLVVFEGPKKQLIIGPPGSGKTELLKFKALELDIEMKNCKREKKIMYILANGSPEYPERNSLLFSRMKEFFEESPLVEIISIVLEEESAEDTEHTTSEIRKKIQSGEYEHAFIDEYWIGSKPTEHKIILELVRGLPGHVWISSLFNYRRDMIEKNKRMIDRTQPLLTALHENEGVERHITQVMRGTNSIVELERDYSKLYADRSYPYGTERILGHSYERLPVTWAVEENVSEMYDKCVDIVYRAITDVILPDISKRDKLTVDPADVLIVDFAIRMDESRQLKQSLLDRLTKRPVPVWTFDDSIECQKGKVTLLQSDKRSASEFLDGTEWRLVVVILPSGMVRETAKLADGAEKLRNYDPYISFFRTMVKLVVISDKWTNKEAFLSDVYKKLNPHP